MRAPRRVLVIEDERPFADNLRDFLLSRKVDEVRVAFDAAGAIKAVEGFEPEFVLVDYALGLDDGLLVLDEIRSRHPRCRALLMTAHPHDSVQRAARERGITTVLDKPFSFADLCSAMSRCEPPPAHG